MTADAAIAAAREPDDALLSVRSHGVARLRFKRRGAATVIDDLYQQGCAKLRFPDRRSGGRRQAVFINTAGGLTGGDRIECAVTWREGTTAVVASQAAERIYRSAAGSAVIDTRLAVGADASAAWLPQETILFHGGRVERTTRIDVAAGGRLIACESLVVGRRAMGETVREGSLRDSWRVRWDGRLVFADTLRLDGDIAGTLARPSIADGSEALATVLSVGEEAPLLRNGLREVAASLPGKVAATTRGPVLVVRIMAASGAEMRLSLLAVLGHLQDPADGLPRVWNC